MAGATPAPVSEAVTAEASGEGARAGEGPGTQAGKPGFRAGVCSLPVSHLPSQS